ncbi:hypothetical protein, variant 1 [Cladophialophora immunda]|uniref:YTH domain-containing protein n=1 Tax=Cladophialophora immunda TaxID=569365 RepID=A0A0D2CU31_9EURO|nr:hypothetical protein, variant 1 [Cladophialophora immunda]KIW34673.1 hypothetical protein, variant 1 [Cladophialophora immunda]OQU98745.1 RNA recognition motif aka RRM, RBD, or RNP domain-containing protein isoform 3 [Cladophialophora immunda]
MQSCPLKLRMDYCGTDLSPPRRPNTHTSRYQGEFALWVGNIPPNTTIMSLRDYFSEPSPWDLLSVSYNPDARYAFVNFSAESARLSAIRQAASRLFEGRRLDCRIRHESRGRSTKVNYGLNNNGNKGLHSRSGPICCDRAKSLRSKVEEFAHFPEAERSSWGKEKYFILKSFSLEALYQSLETGRWHVPKRHVERLNHAFQTASKVYLIFSVNGSGCFFGYATMRSEIRVEEEDLIPFDDEVHVMSHHDIEVEDDSGSSQPEVESDVQPMARSRTESLVSSDSAASSSLSLASTGSVIYQPERRRIIWQASWPRRTIRESPSIEEDLQTASPGVASSSFANISPIESHSKPRSAGQSGGITCPPSTLNLNPTDPPDATGTTAKQAPVAPLVLLPSPSSSTESLFHTVPEDTSADPSFLATLDRFSSPCRIKWLCAQSLPFAAVRGLTNPWNADKEVHVARNVTPMEPGVAAALLDCWAAGPAPGTGEKMEVRSFSLHPR